MLYLAEVQKQKTFIGTLKTEIKLLAFQRTDQSWNPVQTEEVIPTEEGSNFNAGALVLADLNANRQIQRVQEAGRPLVSILQSFSRQLEKSKGQEDEIEQWKESLRFQSEEMSRRQMEMEARLEHLEQIEQKYNQIQKNPPQPGLDRKTLSQVEELLERLSQGTPSASVQHELNLALEIVENQQAILNPHWQRLEEHQHKASQQQSEVDAKALSVQTGFQEWQQAQQALAENKAALQVQITELKTKQDDAQSLNIQLRNQENLYQQLYRLVQPVDQLLFTEEVNLAALEKMPLEQLQQVLQQLHRDWENASRFVHEQEEELRLQQQTIDELQEQLNRASEHDRARIEAELADEKDSYEFLHQTLVGQRESLQQRKDTLRQHQSVLWQKQGISTTSRQEDYKLDLDPILSLIQTQKQQLSQDLKKLEQEIEQMRSYINQAQGKFDHEAHEQQIKWEQLQSWEQELLSLQGTTAEGWGRVNLYQEMLRPIQDSLDGLRQKLIDLASMFDAQAIDSQSNAIAQIRQKLVKV